MLKLPEGDVALYDMLSLIGHIAVYFFSQTTGGNACATEQHVYAVFNPIRIRITQSNLAFPASQLEQQHRQVTCCHAT